MADLEKSKTLLLKIAEIGKKNPSPPHIQNLFPFRHYFDKNGNLIREKLSEIDGLWTRREILTRFLFLQAVLDQGPDIEGVRIFLKEMINVLYEKEVRILHRPLDFFKELGISIESITTKHDIVKNLRKGWAQKNLKNPNAYNLFLDNSKQVLAYAIYRWGVPLAVPYLLEKNLQKENKQSNEPLVDYLESYNSSELMSKEMKSNQQYGLGKAIGDKAAHLFAKWYVHTFRLNKRNDISWGQFSYELPLDSNVGRVLFRSGFLLEVASLKDYQNWEVIRNKTMKDGANFYLRITNIRGNKSEQATLNKNLLDIHKNIATKFLKSHKRGPKKIEIQQLPNSLLYESDYGIGDLDDGLIHIGTQFCSNNATPNCSSCTINNLCEGYHNNKSLITDYRT